MTPRRAGIHCRDPLGLPRPLTSARNIAQPRRTDGDPPGAATAAANPPLPPPAALRVHVRNRANPENEIGQEPRAQQAINGIGF